jgi:hypothetical protein
VWTFLGPDHESKLEHLADDSERAARESLAILRAEGERVRGGVDRLPQWTVSVE